jgi:uncharacterized phage protein (TIGR02218 family)
MPLFARKTELYDWARGAQHWRFTNGDRVATLNSQTYTPAAITRTSLADTQEAMKNQLDVTVPLSFPMLTLFDGGAVPTEIITLTLYQMRGNMVSTAWKGIFANPTFSGKDAVLHHLPPDASAAAIGLTPPWSKTCHLPVYSAGLGRCNASRERMRVDGTVTGVAGRTLQAAAFAAHPDDWFTRGWVQWKVGLATEYRRIVAHAGDTLTLSAPANVPAGTAVTAYPGCDQLLQTCHDKFDNVINYGGCPWLPSSDAFGSDPLY